MDLQPTSEKQLLADIDQLREQFPQTQDLYREVCTLLFFQYGMTPTANKLYQLVRKGSMTAPAEALNKFWDDLREKSRVRIEHPDLPEVLKSAAGELTAVLWASARLLAREGGANHPQEAPVSAAEGLRLAAVKEASNSALAAQLETQSRALQAARERCAVLELELATSRSVFEQALAASHAALAEVQRQAAAKPVRAARTRKSAEPPTPGAALE